jgi:hypothetical protein
MTLKSSEQKVLDILQKEKVNYQGILFNVKPKRTILG